MSQVKFTYIVTSDNIKKIRFAPTTLKVVANKLQIDKSISAVINIKVDDTDMIDLVNVVDLERAMLDCKSIAEKHFNGVAIPVVPQSIPQTIN